MPLIRDKDGKRLHVKSRLMGESLVSRNLSTTWMSPLRSGSIRMWR
jgi:hypothetical protein